MRQQVTPSEASLPAIKQTKHNLYTNYAAMLLGYIQEVVKEKHIAEQFLIDLFNDLQPGDMEQITAPGANAFCGLQLLARKKIAGYISTIEDCEGEELVKKIGGNKFIAMMTHEQQLVFCGVHYHGKSTARLAAELNRPETAIRQLLKDSFTIIRNKPL